MEETKETQETHHKILGIDLETYSSVDLGKCGLYKYVESDDFEILLFAYAFDDDEVQVVDMASGEEVPEEILNAIEDPSIIKAAWNAAFERRCLGKLLGHVLSPDCWRCSMVHAAELSLPLSLKNAAMVLKTGEQKDRAGEALIRKFSVPRKPTKTNPSTRWYPKDDPEAWEMFKFYCKQDVRTERDIRKYLERFPLPDFEWDFYHMDQRINDLGVRIDQELVEKAIECDLALSEAMADKAYQLTGLPNPNSVSQLKSWLMERGIEAPSLGKKEVQKLIGDLDKNGCDEEALDVLKLRLRMAKSSVKKYQAADRCVTKDGRAHGLFQFYGANRTGRWAGRILQLQNLRRNDISTLNEARDLIKMGAFDMVESIYDNTPEILSQLIRTMLIPADGCGFVVADFSAIEARVLAWEAGEEFTLKAFREGKDLYCAVASAMFHVPVVKHGINGELRQKGKIATLACGYQGGVGALKAMGALDMGLKESELPDIIKNWRNANPHVVQYWWDVEQAAIDTVTDYIPRRVGKIKFICRDHTLWIRLPSGRKLAYRNPKLLPNQYGRLSLSFEGIGLNNHWQRQETYGGKIVENCTQAIARDILAEAMLRMQKAGLRIVGHVHDEAIVEVPKDTWTVEEVSDLMSKNPPWCPDIPLKAAGYAAPDFYFKD